VSGQFLTRIIYVFNKLAKGSFGTNNIHTEFAAMHVPRGGRVTQAIPRRGTAPPPCYEDIDFAQCMLIRPRSNLSIAHPILYRRIGGRRGAANPS